MANIDRSEVSRQLAKAIAYKQCMAIVRIVAETDWPSLTPDERAELLATLQFNASETLASIDRSN